MVCFLKIFFPAIAWGLALTPLGSLSAQGQTLTNLPNLTLPESHHPTAWEHQTQNQVNSVFQLRDVAPEDWPFTALQTLVERYGCLQGYPNQTFLGNKALTRHEFAAGLNACLQQIENFGNFATTDTQTLEALVKEFSGELQSLETAIDNLEGRVAFLETHQFSPTTKLFGQSIVGIQGRNASSYDYVFNRFTDEQSQINLITNTQLSLFTQFNPRSILLTGLAMGNGSSSPNQKILEPFTRLGYESDTANNVLISDLTYRHLVHERVAVIVGAAGISAANVFRGSNRVESAGYGPLSRFAQRNPIVSYGGSGSGFGVDWQLAPRWSLQALYATNLGNDGANGGLFGGDFGSTTVGMQLVTSPTNDADFSFQYVRAYSPWGTLSGSLNPTGVGDDQVALVGSNFRAPLSTHAFDLSGDWRISDRTNIGGWFGFSTSNYEPNKGDVQTHNWMTYVTLPDLGGEGHLGGIFFGQPPKISNSSLVPGFNVPSFVRGDLTGVEGGQQETAYHLESFYRLKLSDSLTVTPGFIVVFNPLHNSNNETITIGALRTTLSF